MIYVFLKLAICGEEMYFSNNLLVLLLGNNALLYYTEFSDFICVLIFGGRAKMYLNSCYSTWLL